MDAARKGPAGVAKKKKPEKESLHAKKIKEIAEKEERLKAQKRAEEFEEARNTQMEIDTLTAEVDQIENDEDSYEMDLDDEPRPSTEEGHSHSDEQEPQGDGGLLSPFELHTSSTPGVGGTPVADAGRLGVVLRYGEKGKTRYAFGSGHYPDLPVICREFEGSAHRLCSQKTKTGYKGEKAQFVNIYGVVWDWKGTDEEDALGLLDPDKVKKAVQYKTPAERRKYVKVHHLAKFPTTYVLVRWKNRTEYTWEQATDFKRMWKDQFDAEKKIFKAASAQKKGYDNSDTGRRERETSALLSRQSTPESDRETPDPSAVPGYSTPSLQKEQPFPSAATAAPLLTPPGGTPDPPGNNEEEKETAWKGYLANWMKAQNLTKVTKAQRMSARGTFDGQWLLDD